MVEIRPVDTPAEFVGLQAEWEGLLAQAQITNIFLTFDWLSTWWRHYGGTRRLCMLAAYEGKELTGLAPLMIEERRLLGLPVFRRIAFLGTGISDRLDVLLTPGRERSTLEAMTSYIRSQQWDMVDLQEIPEDSITATLVPELAEPLAMRVEVIEQSVCPVIKLARTPEVQLASVGKNLRHNVGKYSRRLHREHAVTVDFVKEDTRLPGNLEAFLRLYRRAFVHRPNAHYFIGDEFAAFRRDVATRLAVQGHVLLALLRIDGNAVAGELCFPYHGTCYRYNCCYDPDWKDKSVGTVLQWEVIRQAISVGCAEFDYLRGDEPYKYQWGAQPRRHVRIRISRPTPKLHLLQVGLRLARSRPGFKVAGWLRNRLPVGHE